MRKDELPFAIIDTDELAAGLVTVKEQKWELMDADKGTQVKRIELVEWLKGTETRKEWNEGNW